jgi:hypothetical protein
MKHLLFLFALLMTHDAYCQGSPPWERPLRIAYSSNGTNFSGMSVFQDSSGVPSAVRWKGDTLVCVFQWFRQPVNSVTWDKVAVKFSYDAGMSWSTPTPLIINGLPPNFQRPFDPTLAVVNDDSLRIYYSSSDGLPQPGADSIINTYSAISTDGIHYTFEPGSRFDHPVKRVIDPAVIFFNNSWHYSAPAGAPQDGAFHATGPDGINFQLQGMYPSDSVHNWTGNFLVEDSTHLRFYGGGMNLWYNTSVDGFNWLGYVNTNIGGGDPTVIRTGNQDYLIIYVGQPYSTGIAGLKTFKNVAITPNPFREFIRVTCETEKEFRYKIYTPAGQLEASGTTGSHYPIYLDWLNPGVYFLLLTEGECTGTYKIIKTPDR